MDPQGTCNGVQDVAAARIRATPMSRPFPNEAPAIEFPANRSGGANPSPLGNVSLPHTGKRTADCAAPISPSGTDPSSRHNKANIFLSCFKPLASKWVV
jgi:hypothetical protein